MERSGATSPDAALGTACPREVENFVAFATSIRGM